MENLGVYLDTPAPLLVPPDNTVSDVDLVAPRFPDTEALTLLESQTLAGQISAGRVHFEGDAAIGPGRLKLD